MTTKKVEKEFLSGAWFSIVRSKNTFLGELCECSQLTIEYDNFSIDRSKAVFTCGRTAKDVKYNPRTIFPKNIDQTIYSLSPSGDGNYHQLLDIDVESYSYFMIGDTCRKTFFLYSATPELPSQTTERLI